MAKNLLYKLVDGGYEFRDPNCSYPRDPEYFTEQSRTSRYLKYPKDTNTKKRSHRKQNPFKDYPGLQDLF